MDRVRSSRERLFGLRGTLSFAINVLNSKKSFERLVNRRAKQIDEQQVLNSLYRSLGAAVTQLTELHRNELSQLQKSAEGELKDVRRRLSRIERDDPIVDGDGLKVVQKEQTRHAGCDGWAPELIPALRESYKLSKREFAVLLDYAVQSVHNWEKKGGTVPQKDHLIALDRARVEGKSRAWAKVGRAA